VSNTQVPQLSLKLESNIYDCISHLTQRDGFMSWIKLQSVLVNMYY